MIDEHYVNQKLANLYDANNPWSVDRDFYLALAPATQIDILDLGCGTGLICNAFAERGHKVTGVDPALQMLNVARQKPYGSEIEWVCSTAQAFRSNKCFDLIIMTGHAFQVLLTDADVAAACASMWMHLKPHGRVVFESRNPDLDWTELWNHEFNIKSDDKLTKESRHFKLILNAGEFTNFEVQYRLANETLTSRSQLRFMSLTTIADHLNSAGLQVETVLGEWTGEQFDPRRSHEMIFFAGHIGK